MQNRGDDRKYESGFCNLNFPFLMQKPIPSSHKTESVSVNKSENTAVAIYSFLDFTTLFIQTVKQQ